MSDYPVLDYKVLNECDEDFGGASEKLNQKIKKSMEEGYEPFGPPSITTCVWGEAGSQTLLTSIAQGVILYKIV